MKKKNQPKIVVILAAYNGMKWIEDQVKSILNQEGVDLEIFISVDKSEDDTFLFCKHLSESENRIKVLEYGERFGSAAMNFYRLIKEVNFDNFDFVSLADQDDIWLSDKLYTAVSYLMTYDCAGFSSDVNVLFPSGKTSYLKKSYKQKKLDHFFESAGPGCTYVMKVKELKCFKSFLLSNWEKIQSSYFHDWIIYAFFRENKYKWHIDNRPKMLYRYHERNVIGPNKGFKAILKRIKLIQSGGYITNTQILIDLFDNKKENINLSPSYVIKNFFRIRRSFFDSILLAFLIIFKIIK